MHPTASPRERRSHAAARDRALRLLSALRWLVAALALALVAGFAVLAYGATPPYQKQRHVVVALQHSPGTAGRRRHHRRHHHHRRQATAAAAPISGSAAPSAAPAQSAPTPAPQAPQPAPVQPQAPAAPPALTSQPPVTTSGGS